MIFHLNLKAYQKSSISPDVRWTDGDRLNVDGYDVQNGYYTLSSGKKVKAVCVYYTILRQVTTGCSGIKS